MNLYMLKAVQEARNGIKNNEGGPFGCVVVKDGEIVGRGHNQVLLKKDPTCHGEMQAIRAACKTLNTYDLSGCELYTTGEPCPMCLSACLWANITKIYYGCTVAENAELGFRDAKFYETLSDVRAGKSELLEALDQDVCRALFEEYQRKGKTTY